MILLLLGACLTCVTWPSEKGPFDGPLVPGLKLPIRERQWILPGVSSTPPPPEAAVTSANCDDLADGGPVNGPGCITGEIKCGDTIVGHTLGGVERFDSKFYEKKFCTPRTTN